MFREQKVKNCELHCHGSTVAAMLTVIVDDSGSNIGVDMVVSMEVNFTASKFTLKLLTFLVTIHRKLITN